MKASILRLLAAAALLAAALPAVADTGARRPSGVAVWRVCKADIKAFCPHTGLGSAAQKRCMKENYDKLSQPCREIIDRYEAKPEH